MLASHALGRTMSLRVMVFEALAPVAGSSTDQHDPGPPRIARPRRQMLDLHVDREQRLDHAKAVDRAAVARQLSGDPPVVGRMDGPTEEVTTSNASSA